MKEVELIDEGGPGSGNHGHYKISKSLPDDTVEDSNSPVLLQYGSKERSADPRDQGMHSLGSYPTEAIARRMALAHSERIAMNRDLDETGFSRVSHGEYRMSESGTGFAMYYKAKGDSGPPQRISFGSKLTVTSRAGTHHNEITGGPTRQ